jgi:hypothetical protein
MTTTTTSATAGKEVALPAVRAEDWQPNGDGRFYRNFEGENAKSSLARNTAHKRVLVYAHGVQHDGGGIDDGTTDPVFDAPGISIATIDTESDWQTRYRHHPHE